MLVQEGTRVGVGPLALESEVAAVAVWLCCNDPSRRMHFAFGCICKSDVVARGVLDRVPSDVAPGPRVIGADAAPHHPMRGRKGLPDRAGAILHECLHDKYLACASDEDTSTWHSADGATGTPPHATLALDCLVCKGGAVTTARSGSLPDLRRGTARRRQ